MPEEPASLGERRGWTADEVVAIYEPEPGGWTARVRWVQMVGHTYHRFHVAVIDPNGHERASAPPRRRPRSTGRPVRWPATRQDVDTPSLPALLGLAELYGVAV